MLTERTESSFKTSGWETEQVYSYNPGACTRPSAIEQHRLELEDQAVMIGQR